MKFTVNNGNPSFSNNALKSGNRLATYRQTQQEHDDLLDISNLPDYPFYVAMPEGPEKEEFKDYLVVQAIQREKDDPKYWDEEEPRKPIAQSSSWVGDIEYNPDNNLTTKITNVAAAVNAATAAKMLPINANGTAPTPKAQRYATASMINPFLYSLPCLLLLFASIL